MRSNSNKENHLESYVSTEFRKGYFKLSANKKAAPIYASLYDFKGVLRAIGDLQTDICKVTSIMPTINFNESFINKEIVIVGTLSKNPLIKKLAKNKRIDASLIKGKWETYLIQVLEKPFKEIDRALVIVGSDKRGTIFGIYDLTYKIGVSPWYWWNDVPVNPKRAIYIKPVKEIQSPSVKYRGIFLNDEYPNLTRWVTEKYGMVPLNENPPIPFGVGNYNSEFYKRIFEVILRLKGNYLWPAMWNNAFNEDDPINPALADEYGIIMGTSHQEPMLRAQKEWDRRFEKILGQWDYSKHAEILKKFWREGIRRNKKFESIVTIGLRGANDTELSQENTENNKILLEIIVNEQRKILAEEVNSDVTQIPQIWCLYKEVLDYYKAGLKVPDDVIILWSDDNWGNVRRLPTEEECNRTGGAGIYYHFDYHGMPRSYQWINTSPIPKIWDQMSLAKQYGADKVWIANVGHFKAYSFPIEYFFELAWDTTKWTNENLMEYTQRWARHHFEAKYAIDIAEIISKYTKYNARRKPELLSPSTYSLTNYNEAETIVADYKAILAKAENIYNKLPKGQLNAFFQLILFPVKAGSIVNELYVTAGKNNLYANQKRAATNDKLTEVIELFQKDMALMNYFNYSFANRKWMHFQDQPHLGYMSWNDPPCNSLNAIKLNHIAVPEDAIMGVSIEESESVWPEELTDAELPLFDSFTQRKHYFEIFNKGHSPFSYNISSSDSWILLPIITKAFSGA